MTTKLKLNPDICYLLGIFSGDRPERSGPIKLLTRNERMLERFVSIFVTQLDVKPNKFLIKEQDEGLLEADLYHSKLKRLFEAALKRRLMVFRWPNEYSANYLAGIFDSNGGLDNKGLYIRRLSLVDSQLMENLGIHTSQKGAKSYIRNASAFIALIKSFSIVLSNISVPGNERDLR